MRELLAAIALSTILTGCTSHSAPPPPTADQTVKDANDRPSAQPVTPPGSIGGPSPTMGGSGSPTGQPGF
jgi:hypothetical protein